MVEWNVAMVILAGGIVVGYSWYADIALLSIQIAVLFALVYVLYRCWQDPDFPVGKDSDADGLKEP